MQSFLSAFKGKLSRLVVASKLPQYLCYVKLKAPEIINPNVVLLQNTLSDIRVVWND